MKNEAIYRKSAIFAKLSAGEPCLWRNPAFDPDPATLQDLPLSMTHVVEAEQRLQKFAPLLESLFPELAPSGGIIESRLLPAPDLKEKLPANGAKIDGKLWIKADHDLPVAGSVKARGGVYEVLCFAEELAVAHGLLVPGGDYRDLASPEARELFGKYTVSVGSTGNLGLSIGLIAAALGFQACVHMSVEAKQWKKDRLRRNGVHVIEHDDDYSRAVAAGRASAESDPCGYFVDDENSERLFSGYSVAALRLRQQLQQENVRVDEEHPLFVYLPCGVGGAPGGITFGLRHVFGSAVHCFFAEPVEAPCMLLTLASASEDDLSVYDVGLRVDTEADGLAVARASKFVAQMIQSSVSGVFTVKDERLFRDLYLLEKMEGIRIEPSAAAGFSGPELLCNDPEGRRYIEDHKLEKKMSQANHILWTTGGSFVPAEEYKKFHELGKKLQKQCNS
ncbi:D-serine ammonia-lyase [Emcibacter nanhaiensis]|uniref:Probable D-serine dehydratase n=1 Tax=Emcibacter nanhaiensis TaxID=1505037 RepID=A0A501PHD2_9PROT|nr:D-serine ammonia-lyase [Emcibacter nanhaiensis]TPD59266.1 D-serine ammonia-lyase [Emcibacter nanhaiensis]